MEPAIEPLPLEDSEALDFQTRDAPQPPPAYPMPPPNSAAWPAAELGMKLACGFEMQVAAHPAAAPDSPAAAPAGQQSAEEGASWQAFQASLRQEQAGSDAAGADGATPGPAAARQRFAAIADYERAADVQAHPVAHISRLLQVWHPALCRSMHCPTLHWAGRSPDTVAT